MSWRASESYTVDPIRVAVLGAGHAGRGLASYLSIHGFDVSLYNRTFANVKRISRRGGIKVQGLFEAFAHLSLVTDDIAKAVEDRDILIIIVPAQAHTFFAKSMIPHLESRQTILLMPGRTGGALEFARTLRSQSYTDDILLGEAQTFSFVSRITGPDSVLISKVKNSTKVSAFPAFHNHRFMRSLRRLPITFNMADDVMETSLDNVGAMLHPTPTILCAGLLESKEGGYNHYHDAISKSVGRLIERMDAERISVSREFVSQSVSLLEWLRSTYDAKGTTLCECIRSIDAYDDIGSPSSLNHRYVLEDVPTGLVPISYLGRLAGVETPAIDAVINMACQLYDYNFWSSGRNLGSLGLEGLNPSEVQEYVRTGIIPEKSSELYEIPDVTELEVDEI
ncbi:MAG: NADP transhydrogenase subunit alpha [Candidatus Thorarchaeota archaeon]|nr:MAG: NADP transhydrogenase subunit alpha [Candidatus Thorarchaeota archaeon]